MPERKARRGTRRRIAVALVVPAVAVFAVLTAAGAATGATGRSPTAIPSDPVEAPNGGQATDIAPPGDTGGGGGTTGGTTPYTSSYSSSTSPSTSPSTSASPTPSASGSGEASPSGTDGSGGAVVPGAPGGSGSGCARTTTGPTTVKVGTAGGKQNVLVDQNGCALYLFTQDTNTTSACDATCEATWPPAIAPGQAGTGVQQQNLTAFTRSGGKSQVTYFSHQLYHYSGDKAPGDAKGQGLNQTWWLVGADGQPVQSWHHRDSGRPASAGRPLPYRGSGGGLTGALAGGAQRPVSP